jgi:hypothetical protein
MSTGTPDHDRRWFVGVRIDNHDVPCPPDQWPEQQTPDFSWTEATMGTGAMPLLSARS